jgi:nitrate reductase NapE component
VDPSTNRRKGRLVDRQFQIGLAWRNLMVFLLFFILGIILVFAPSMFGLLTGESLESLAPAASEFLILHHRIWPAVVIVLVGMFAYTIFISHRIAGPIYRINEVLRKMIGGEFPDSVTFRKNDYFQETAALLDTLSKALVKEKGAGGGSGTREPTGESGPTGKTPE